MTRIAGWSGLVLGIACLAGGLQGFLGAGSTVSLVTGIVAGGILLWSSARTARGGRLAPGIMVGVAFLIMAGFIAAYFQTYRFWPPLVMVILGCLTFGLGVLGLVLDRYQPSAGGPRGL